MQRREFVRGANAILLGAALVIGCIDSEDHGDIEELRKEQQSKDIPGRYIVMLKKGANAQAAANAVAAKPTHVYTRGISGFAASLNAGQVEALSHRPDVVTVEPDQIVTTTAECPGPCPAPFTQLKSNGVPAYSIDRTDQRSLPLSSSYTYACRGNGVKAFVFDTWMDVEHEDFDGRASRGYDGYPNDPGEGESCSGHATHVAGIIGGTDYGIAKQVEIISVEVLDCTGHGTWSKLLAGIDWVLANKGNAPAVANMSLSGGWSPSVNAAIDELTAKGVFVAVAAGNDNMNACWFSPAAASTATVVAASNSNDARAPFSNHGPCVDIYAGGTNVRSAWPGDGSATASGTSMATPHVAGVAALYKQTYGNTPASQIETELETWATKNKITSNAANTANRLLYWWCSGK